MSKKKKLRRRRFNLTAGEFVQYACQRCGLCDHKSDVSTTFCYDGFYTDEPKEFLHDCLPALQEVKHLLLIGNPKRPTLSDDDEFEYALEFAFCSSKLCSNFDGQNCKYKAGCLVALRYQMLGTTEPSKAGNRKHHGRKNKFGRKNKAGKKKKATYIPPTPKFFCNGGFRKEIDDILNGNNLEQQDTGEKCSGRSATVDGGQAANSES